MKMENEKKNTGLYAVIAILCVLVIVLGGYIVSSKLLDKRQDNQNVNECEEKECSCQNSIELANEDLILNLISKSDLAEGFAKNGGLKLVKNKNNNNFLKDKESLKKFNDDYIIPLILQRMEFKNPHNTWEQNEGILALAIAYINSDPYSYFDSNKIYTKQIIEETVKYLFNEKISLNTHYSLSHSLNHSEYYYIGDYYYFASALAATEGYCLEYNNIKENGNTIEYIYTACNTRDTELDHFAAGSNVHITYEKNNNQYFIKSITENI